MEAELSRLKNQKRFGLVYENHRPEVLYLNNRIPKRGDYVALKGKSLSETWKVLTIKDLEASLSKEDLSEDPTLPQELSAHISELIVVKRFGDPIYPALTHLASAEHPDSVADAPRHSLIEADNYHALQLLRYIYRGKVDCIYIDPPYNTGARDWKYNNDYVDLTDAWRHSKWLSFMQKRLALAKDLLNPRDSVLIVTIDEHEVHHLACLLREVFPNARQQMVTIVNNAAGVSQGTFGRVEEYALFCFIGESLPNPGPDDLLSDGADNSVTPYWFSLIRYGGVNAVPSKRDNLVYPIGIDPVTLKIVGTGPTLRDRVEAGVVKRASDDWLPDSHEKLGRHDVVWPYRKSGKMATWQVAPDTLMALQEEGFVRVRRHARGPGGNKYSISYVKTGNRQKVTSGAIPILGKEDSGALILGHSERNVVAKTVWRRARHDAGKWGSRLLRDSLGDVPFDYAKSPYAVLDSLAAAVGHKKDALILDFFAGSGTTLVSTLLLNERDGGKRRCILVTNNEVSLESSAALSAQGLHVGDAAWEESGICKAVTWPRARNTISGTFGNGAPLTAEYFDVKFVERERDRRIIQLAFVEGASLSSAMRTDLLKLIDGMAPSNASEKSFCISSDETVAVIFDPSKLDEFIDAVEEVSNLDRIYVATTSKKVFAAAKDDITATLGAKVFVEQERVPMSRGFPVGIDYYKLEFLEPGSVSAGQAFAAILPILWMMAGCVGRCPEVPSPSAKWLIQAERNFSVLLQEKFFNAYLKKLQQDYSKNALPPYVFLVTDEDDSFITWRSQILQVASITPGARIPIVIQLYRNYLDNFRLQVSSAIRGK